MEVLAIIAIILIVVTGGRALGTIISLGVFGGIVFLIVAALGAILTGLWQALVAIIPGVIGLGVIALIASAFGSSGEKEAQHK